MTSGRVAVVVVAAGVGVSVWLDRRIGRLEDAVTPRTRSVWADLFDRVERIAQHVDGVSGPPGGDREGVDRVVVPP